MDRWARSLPDQTPGAFNGDGREVYLFHSCMVTSVGSVTTTRFCPWLQLGWWPRVSALVTDQVVIANIRPGPWGSWWENGGKAWIRETFQVTFQSTCCGPREIAISWAFKRSLVWGIGRALDWSSADIGTDGGLFSTIPVRVNMEPFVRTECRRGENFSEGAIQTR